MEITAAIPMAFEPEATVEVERWEPRQERRSLVQSGLRHFVDIEATEVSRPRDPEYQGASRILFEVHQEADNFASKEAVNLWPRQIVATFPPNVSRHLSLLETFENNDAS